MGHCALISIINSPQSRPIAHGRRRSVIVAHFDSRSLTRIISSWILIAEPYLSARPFVLGGCSSKERSKSHNRNRVRDKRRAAELLGPACWHRARVGWLLRVPISRARRDQQLALVDNRLREIESGRTSAPAPWSRASGASANQWRPGADIAHKLHNAATNDNSINWSRALSPLRDLTSLGCSPLRPAAAPIDSSQRDRHSQLVSAIRFGRRSAPIAVKVGVKGGAGAGGGRGLLRARSSAGRRMQNAMIMVLLPSHDLSGGKGGRVRWLRTCVSCHWARRHEAARSCLPKAS